MALAKKPHIPPPFGRMLRRWRKTRGFSQLELALTAEVPQRHISFLETGRARPREEMVLRLSRALDVPLRERNRLLVAAGLPPLYRAQPTDQPASQFFRSAAHDLLASHAPYPALALDGHWQLIDANLTAQRLSPSLTLGANFAEALFAQGPFRQSIENWKTVARIAFARLNRDAREHPHSERLTQLVDYAGRCLREANVVPFAANIAGRTAEDTPAICPKIRVADSVVSTFSMVASFTSAYALSLDELRVELLFPADAASAAILRELAES